VLTALPALVCLHRLLITVPRIVPTPRLAHTIHRLSNRVRLRVNVAPAWLKSRCDPLNRPACMGPC
jgi:hypothetical protein